MRTTTTTNLMKEIQKFDPIQTFKLDPGSIKSIRKAGFGQWADIQERQIYDGLVAGHMIENGYLPIRSKAIVDVCRKFHSKNMVCRPAGQYIGDLDTSIVDALAEFETKTGIDIEPNMGYVMAPEQNFREVRSEDPLYLLRLGEDIFVPLFKWGTDLELPRKMLG